jgi:hypothetical protein
MSRCSPTAKSSAATAPLLPTRTERRWLLPKAWPHAARGFTDSLRTELLHEKSRYRIAEADFRGDPDRPSVTQLFVHL